MHQSVGRKLGTFSRAVRVAGLKEDDTVSHGESEINSLRFRDIRVVSVSPSERRQMSTTMSENNSKI